MSAQRLRRTFVAAAAALVAITVVAGVAWIAGVGPFGSGGGGAPPFSADFETGDLSQWPVVNVLDSRRDEAIRVTAGGARQGRYAARVMVAPGDRPGADGALNPAAAGERAELTRQTGGEEREGDEFFYSFSFRLPPDWVQVADGWRIPLQFHSVDDDLGGRSPVPPVALDFVPPAGRPQGQGAGGLWLEVHGGDLTHEEFAEGNKAQVLPLPVDTGVWHDLVLRVRWSRDDGAVTVWHREAGEERFARVTELDDIPTMLYVTEPEARVARVFLRTGLYRAPSGDRTDVLEIDAISRATSFAAAAGAFGQ
ncbi:MAG TPA: polysaccharide lyase [Miltoncostaeaceae bacterium]|nr:polysaccharide lyase [Miltoncostaeaceae bacterium]